MGMCVSCLKPASGVSRSQHGTKPKKRTCSNTNRKNTTGNKKKANKEIKRKQPRKRAPTPCSNTNRTNTTGNKKKATKEIKRKQPRKRAPTPCSNTNRKNTTGNKKKATKEIKRKQPRKQTGSVQSGRKFPSLEVLVNHMNPKRLPCKKAAHNNQIDRKCPQCTHSFPTLERLKQHQAESHRETTVPKVTRQSYIDNFYKSQVAVKGDDMKASVAEVKQTIDPIMAHVRGQDGGKVYSADVRKAGSHAIKAKIGKADEFDTNIPLNDGVSKVSTRGRLPYAYADKIKKTEGGPSPKNMNVDRMLVDATSKRQMTEIAPGHASVKVEAATPTGLTHRGDLIPHLVQKDFHNKVSNAIEDLHLKGIHLSRQAHGPALTMTIKRPGNHDINVDLTPSLPCKAPVTENGWPRKDTKKAYSKEKIEAVKDVGVHLVPKGDETWTKSYSNAEKILLKDIDAGNGCRKIVLKCLKRHAQVCSSRPDGLPGFSSHILKHQVLWSSEKHAAPEYWHAKNVDTCLMDTMKDVENNLRCGKLPDYFNPSQNILANKDRGALNRMADHLKQERQKLAHMDK